MLLIVIPQTVMYQYQLFELVNPALWGQMAGSAYFYSKQMLPFGFARHNQCLFFQLYFI